MAQAVKPADVGIDIGTVFLGKYRVDSILGQGGMGVVAECTHLQLGERVAIKMLRKDVLLDADAVERFTREARAAAKLKSEYVARVTDTGTFDGVPYMVMEYLEGHDLGQLLEQRGTLPVAWATELVLQTAEALAEAHSLGIVHRDVKPTNLFVTWRPDGTALVKVLDFGISKSPTGADMQLTQTQSLLGTPAYMSPEQMRSARLVDSRSDIWSLGTVLYELIEGRRPFEAESFSEMCVKVAVDAPAPMMNTPVELQRVILRCLAKAPEQRYPTMADLGNDLVPFVADQHQGNRLVERMGRMLRRSAHSWDGESSSSIQKLDSDISSGRWSAGSDPAGRVWDVKSEPFIPVPGRGSEPRLTRAETYPVGAAPSTLMEHGRPRRRGLAIVVGLGLVIGVAVAVAFGMRDDKQPAPTNGSAAGSAEAAALQTPPDAATVAPVPPVTDPNSAGAGSASVTATTTTTTPTTTTTTTAIKNTRPTGKPNGSKQNASKQNASKQNASKQHPTTPESKTTKQTPPIVTPPVTPPTSKCDPFTSAHGCNPDGSLKK